MSLPYVSLGCPDTAADRKAIAAPDRAERVRRVVDQAPPWTPEQRRRLSPLLAGTLPGTTPLAGAA